MERRTRPSGMLGTWRNIYWRSLDSGVRNRAFPSHDNPIQGRIGTKAPRAGARKRCRVAHPAGWCRVSKGLGRSLSLCHGRLARRRHTNIARDETGAYCTFGHYWTRPGWRGACPQRRLRPWARWLLRECAIRSRPGSCHPRFRIPVSPSSRGNERGNADSSNREIKPFRPRSLIGTSPSRQTPWLRRA